MFIKATLATTLLAATSVMGSPAASGCPGRKPVYSALLAYSDASSFCSDFLPITTLTATKTALSTVTSAKSTVSSTETVYSASVVYHSIATCAFAPATTAALAKRSTIPIPSALSAFAPTALSSGCKCLHLPTPTATITTTALRTKSIPKTTVTTTSTSYTLTTTSTTTLTTAATAVPTAFQLLASGSGTSMDNTFVQLIPAEHGPWIPKEVAMLLGSNTSSPITATTFSLDTSTGFLSVAAGSTNYSSYTLAQTGYEDGVNFYSPANLAAGLAGLPNGKLNNVYCCIDGLGDLHCQNPNGDDGMRDSLSVWQGPDYDDFAMLVLDTLNFEEYYTPLLVSLKVVEV